MDDRAKNSAAGKRIEKLLDSGSFVEIGGAVTARSTDFNMPDKDTPADGVITGYGMIDGNLVYVYSQDASVLGGAVGEMHAKKIVTIFDMALKMGAPVIGFLDSAGLRLQEGTDALEAFGNLYTKLSMASGVIPQITAVCGSCGGGLSIVPAISDFTFMDEQHGELFVNSPNVLPGNNKAKCDTSSAAFQSEKTGNVDGYGTEDEIIGQIRSLITILPCNNEENASYDECTDDLNRVCANIGNATEDTVAALGEISDAHVFFETRKHYARDMVTGFIRLNGMTVGALANRSKIYGEDGNAVESFDGTLSVGAARKAADFVKFCDAFNIPVLTLTNVTGFQATCCSEKNLAKAVAGLVYAFSEATVPKVNVIIGKAYGNAYVAMNSKSVGADMVYAWPQSEVGMMDARLAAQIMYEGEGTEVISEQTKAYRELQSSPMSAARRGYVDTVIQPEDTRKYVIGAFEMLFTKREFRPDKKHGTV